MADAKKHTGGCHCGKVRFEVEMALDKVLECDCSICSKRGTLLAFVPLEQFRILSGEDHLTDYQFNRHVIHHMFCNTCGILSFARAKNPQDGRDMAAINARCVDDVDIEKLSIQKFDGKKL